MPQIRRFVDVSFGKLKINDLPPALLAPIFYALAILLLVGGLLYLRREFKADAELMKSELRVAASNELHAAVLKLADDWKARKR